MLARYDASMPGLADRIVRMAEREQEHAHTCDREAMAEYINHRKRGQHYGLALGVACLATSGVAAYFKETAIGITAISALAVVLTIFVLHRVYVSKDPPDQDGDGR